MENNNRYTIDGVQFFIRNNKKFEIESEAYETIQLKPDMDLTLPDDTEKFHEKIYIAIFMLVCIQYNKNEFCLLNDSLVNRMVSKDSLPGESLLSFYHKLFQSDNAAFSDTDAAKNTSMSLKIIAGRRAELFAEKADISLLLDRDGGVTIKYSQNLFHHLFIQSFVESMIILLDQAGKDMSRLLTEIPFTTEHAKQKLVAWGRNREAYDFTKPIYELFMDQAKRTPDQTAYYYIDETQTEHKINYKNLDEQSSILAGKLQNLGIMSGKVVGVYMERSIPYIISLLGILKAGGIYLPLDMTYPSQYLEMISDEAKIQVILTDDKNKDVTFENTQVLNINRLEGANDFQHFATIDYPAILMYTSGSTGKPKGVLHRQLQVINRLNFMWSKYAYQDGDVMAQRTTVNYMPSMWEFFAGLLKGVPTVIFADSISKNPDLFLSYIDKYRVSFLTLVPSLFRMLESAGEKFRRFAQVVRCWVSCGEPMTLEIFNKVVEFFPHSVLVNDYGSTEVNGILYYDSAGRNEKSASLPLFSPVSNADIYLFDEYMRQVPIGVPGGIYVGGLVLSTGYIESEELNREKFIPNPLEGHEGEILFKLGDRAVFHHDGRFELLGRNDLQVKIRGIRMNIGGIEEVIKGFDKVKQVIVVARRQASGNHYLAAYLEMNEVTGEEAVRGYLETQLPPYMMPSQFYFMDKIPLLPNGKADRKKLEDMSEKEVVKVKINTEEITMKYSKIIVDIASDVLGIPIDHIKTGKKYYELGFDSVSIVELLKRINETIDTELTLASLYDNPCIDDLIKNCMLHATQKAIPEQTGSKEGNKIRELIYDITGLQNDSVSSGATWEEIGLDFSGQSELISRVKETFGVELSLYHFTEAADINALTKLIGQKTEEDTYKMKQKEDNTRKETRKDERDQPNHVHENQNFQFCGTRKVAVIGMSCHYPGAQDKEVLWENLMQGVNSIVEIPQERWDYRKCFINDADTGSVLPKWGGLLEDISRFDFKYFGISLQEAGLMDPQQKICLEETCHAMEDAGYSMRDINGKDIGVFIGARTGDYMNNLAEHQNGVGGFAFIGNDSAIISARISYLFNLHGPCMTIDTACSSSLSAIHQAINAILLSDCDTAISGGAFVMNSQTLFENSARMGMLSKDGQCKTFDDHADGFVPAEGSGIVILKDYEKAVADGDRIYGVILASGINQDGKTNGITAPSSEEQYRLEKSVYEKANLSPAEISYVETHGTGTKLGDPIEIEALTKAFKEATDRNHFCALGSIKTNIGHCITASGVAGLIKVMLCMQHNLLPANLNFQTCNHYIDLANSPFYLLHETKEWKRQEGVPRHAALSSFGFGGSNCHMVMEDYTVRKDKKAIPNYLIVLSGHSQAALEQKAVRLREWMQDDRNHRADIGDISYTLASIEKYPERIAFVVSSKEDLLGYLEAASRQIERYLVSAVVSGKDSLLQNEELELLKDDYLKGLDITRYKKWLQQKGYGIISLPPYPYQKEVCYFPHKNHDGNDPSSDGTPDFHIYDHVLDGEICLPGAAFLEIIHREYIAAGHPLFNTINHVCFQSFGRQGEAFEFAAQELQDGIEYRICEKQYKNILFTCEIDYESPVTEHINIQVIKSKFNKRMLRKECYDEFLQMGLDYGVSYSLIEEICYSDTETLSLIKQSSRSDYKWNPFVIDAAFQSVLPLLKHQEEHVHKYVPYTIKKVAVYGDLNNVRYVFTERIGDRSKYTLQRYNLKLLSSQGAVLAIVEGFTRKKIVKEESTLQIFIPKYEFAKAKVEKNQSGYLLIVGAKENLYMNQDLKQAFSGRILYAPEEGNPFFDYRQFFKRLASEGKRITRILCLMAYSNNEEQSRNVLFSFTSMIQGIVGEMRGETIKVVCVYDGNRKDASYYSALSGFGLSLQHEYENLFVETVNLPGYQKGDGAFEKIIAAEVLSGSKEQEVIYENGSRKIKSYSSYISHGRSGETGIKEQGVYVITGGFGGIGISLARYMLSGYNVQLILLGRRDVSVQEVSEIFEYGQKPVYYQTDMGNAASVAYILSVIEDTYGVINGFFHCAGATNDCMLRYKNRENMQEVIKSKINGMLSLNQYREQHPACMLVCFSSVAAVVGNQGQTDYAYANHFMDDEVMRHSGECSYSYNWSLWNHGTMGNNSYVKNKLLEDFGFLPIEDEEGFDAMFHLMSKGIKRAVITKATASAVLFSEAHTAEKEDSYTGKAVVCAQEPVTSGYEDEIETIAKKVFDKTQFKRTTSFEDDDIDSISLTEFAGAVTSRFGIRISAALLFEYNTIELLAGYIRQEMGEMHTTGEAVAKTENSRGTSSMRDSETAAIKPLMEDDIAVVGLSGRFPGSESIEAFWNSLWNHASYISETPKDRWDANQLDESIREYAKYGGFLDNVKGFDPLYFHISPAEARLMDPQQRLLLEEAVRCFEHAGIDLAEISGRQISVYIGIFSNDYLHIINRSDAIHDPNVIAGNDHAMMANRISYYFNLKGNSEAVDTACSSSLACVLKAVRDIRSGECEGALVGGVSLILDSAGSVRVGKLGFLSKDEFIKSYTAEADGYVRGEGVGVMYLKSLSKAVADGNQILAVIKGGAVNHGGKGHYLMEPNGVQEAEVIKAAYKDAGVRIGTVNYIEAHGTGTKSGDENEIYAFKKAFRELQKETDIVLPKNFCGIGTVKPNIGHLEAASGMASIIKLIMALYHKKIPATLMHGPVNPDYDLEDSCFYIQDQNRSWEPILNQEGEVLPRRGEVHAYGYGGTNVHLILEEYTGNFEEQTTGTDSDVSRFIFPVSANTEDALTSYVQKYQSFIEKMKEDQFVALAFSMQMTKMQLAERAAFIAGNKEELLSLMENYRHGIASPMIKTKMGREVRDMVTDLFGDAGHDQVIHIMRESENLSAIANLWVNGIDLDWNIIFRYQKRFWINLPSYPFAEEDYWITEEPGITRSVMEPVRIIKQNQEETIHAVRKIIAQCLEVSVSQIKDNVKLSDIGMNSIMLAKLKFKLEEYYGIQLRTVELADNETATGMINYINNELVNRNATV